MNLLVTKFFKIWVRFFSELRNSIHFKLLLNDLSACELSKPACDMTAKPSG